MKSALTEQETRLFLVYQNGTANVFHVKAFNLADFGRDAERLYQGDFRGAKLFCKGAGAIGAIVRTAICNMVGDIIDADWNEDFDNAPFITQADEVRIN